MSVVGANFCGPARAEPKSYSYSVYPAWFGGIGEAKAGVGELAATTAQRHGWMISNIEMYFDGIDIRFGDRYVAVVRFKEDMWRDS